jgi:hypothetical protein
MKTDYLIDVKIENSRCYDGDILISEPDETNWVWALGLLTILSDFCIGVSWNLEFKVEIDYESFYVDVESNQLCRFHKRTVESNHEVVEYIMLGQKFFTHEKNLRNFRKAYITWEVR